MRKAIAIDFDGCLCKDAFPAIGQPNWDVINRAKVEQRAGAGLILWTCREDQLLLDAVAACEGWGLTFDAVNESLPDWIEEFKTRPRKVGATEYWDDKALRMSTAPKFAGGPGDNTIELITPTPGNKDMALEPCPFCGSNNVVYERYGCKTGDRWRCWCADCIAGIDPGWAQQKIDVREMWNRRATRPNPPLTLEQFRDMDGEPVFIRHLEERYGDWALVDLKYELCRTAKGGLAIFETYGKTWIACRHQLEGAHK